MLRYQRGRQVGASLTELVTMICLILIFIWIAAEKIWELRVAAERTGVASTIGTLRSALGMQVAGRAVKQGIPAVIALEGSNPMDLLRVPPPNYIGELANVDPASVGGGRWYFDLDKRVLIYRVQFEEGFSSSLTGPARIRLAIRVAYDDTDGNGRFDPGRDQLRNVSLHLLEPYRWVPAD